MSYIEKGMQGNFNPLSSTGTEILAKGIVDLQKRVDKEKRETSLSEITLDKSNKVSFPGFPYLFEALDETIIVSIDLFRSGFECKTCKGTGWISVRCNCEETDRPGYRYTQEQLDHIHDTLGDEVTHAREQVTCPTCHGEFENLRAEKECVDCKGKGATLVLPETSKQLPTTGVIVSMGQNVPQDCGFKRGDRILFGAYAGQMIPTKGGAAFKMMDYTAAKVRIEGGEDLASFDFVIQEIEP